MEWKNVNYEFLISLFLKEKLKQYLFIAKQTNKATGTQRREREKFLEFTQWNHNP